MGLPHRAQRRPAARHAEPHARRGPVRDGGVRRAAPSHLAVRDLHFPSSRRTAITLSSARHTVEPLCFFSAITLSSARHTVEPPCFFSTPVPLRSCYRTVSGCGCLAIGDLAAEKDNLVRLTQSGACEAAVGALRRHDDVPDVVVQACYAIHFLCFSQNNIAWMGANGRKPSPTQPLFSILSSDPYPSISFHLPCTLQRRRVRGGDAGAHEAHQRRPDDHAVHGPRRGLPRLQGRGQPGPPARHGRLRGHRHGAAVPRPGTAYTTTPPPPPPPLTRCSPLLSPSRDPFSRPLFMPPPCSPTTLLTMPP